MEYSDIKLSEWIELEAVLEEPDKERLIDLVGWISGKDVTTMPYDEFVGWAEQLEFLGTQYEPKDPQPVDGHYPVSELSEMTVNDFTNYGAAKDPMQLARVIYRVEIDPPVSDFLDAKNRFEQLIMTIHKGYPNLFPEDGESDAFSTKWQWTPWISEVSKEWGVSWFETLEKPIVLFMNTVCFLIDRNKRQERDPNKREY